MYIYRERERDDVYMLTQPHVPWHWLEWSKNTQGEIKNRRKEFTVIAVKSSAWLIQRVESSTPSASGVYDMSSKILRCKEMHFSIFWISGNSFKKHQQKSTNVICISGSSWNKYPTYSTANIYKHTLNTPYDPTIHPKTREYKRSMCFPGRKPCSNENQPFSPFSFGGKETEFQKQWLDPGPHCTLDPSNTWEFKAPTIVDLTWFS